MQQQVGTLSSVDSTIGNRGEWDENSIDYIASGKLDATTG